MRPRTLIIIAVVIVAVFLAVPLVGYAGLKTKAAAVNIDVTALCISNGATFTNTYTCTFETVNASKGSYFSYVGQWYGDLLTVAPSFPCVQVSIIDHDTYKHIAPLEAWAITYGQTWTHTFENVQVEPGQNIYVIISFFKADSQSAGAAAGFAFTVPG